MMRGLKLIFFLAELIVCSQLKGVIIKNLTHLNGDRDNQLVGYGLVVGLDGKGDQTPTFAVKSIKNTLKHFGITIEDNNKPKNIAAVMVTADIKAFAQVGSRMDVAVSSIGDAKSLQGGVLVQTPLKGVDGVVYAVAQGPIVLGGFMAGTNTVNVQQNHTTVARVVNGAIIEREVPVQLVNNNAIELNLLNPDFVTAVRIADTINEFFPGSAQALSPATVNVIIPTEYVGQLTNFIARIGSYEVIPDVKAKIIINERTGTIIATDQVRISSVAVSHGNLTITVAEEKSVSQARELALKGETKEVVNTTVQTKDSSKNFITLNQYPTVPELTTALNQIGASTRDIITILQSMKEAGALQAELIVL